MNFLNYTPHALNIVCGEEIITILPSGTVARIDIFRKQMNAIPYSEKTSIPITYCESGEIINLPEARFGTIFIVSAMVAEVAKRVDVMSPGELVRDWKGVVIGCKGLSSYRFFGYNND